MATSDRLSVLLVDDEPDITGALEIALRRHKFRIHAANSAAEGLAILASRPIDVVVSDHQMPGVTGSRFLTQVREAYPDTVRIILSGHADAQAMLDAINEARVFRFLTKPCAADDLAACIADGADARAKARRDDADKLGGTARARLELQQKFDEALQGLWMALQPVVRADDRAVVAYEALVRSDHADLKTPDKLFEVAAALDRTGDLERAIRADVAARLDEIPEGPWVLVNVHPRSLSDPTLYAEDAPLHAHSGRIVLEITEHERLQGIPKIAEDLRALRSQGYRLAVDDLGSGFSSLTSFALMRPDFVKFDMEFVRDIQRSTIKAKLMKSMTSLCRELGILTIAEGIETAEEFSTAQFLGCDLLQGFYIARPERAARIFARS